MLGGSDLQVSAIIEAKKMGLYVITCDYLPDNPGHKFSDEYHNVSTTDREAVLQLAINLGVDGVLAYASDPAASTAAYVAEKLNLPTNPLSAVEIMSRKDLFRLMLKEHGFNVPFFSSFSKYEEALAFVRQMKRTVVLKPVDSSGSKGVFKVGYQDDFKDKFNKALSFSRSGIVIIEEYIDKKGFQIGGDGFLVDGRLVFRCFGDLHFSSTNELLPCALSMPSLHEPHIVRKVHDELERALSFAGMKIGGVNFDVIVDECEEVYILEIGPRNGGNMIPELIQYCTGVDLKIYAIRSAFGMDCSDLKVGSEEKYFSHYVVHSQKSGHIKTIKKSNELESMILHEHYTFKISDHISPYSDSSDRLGVLLLKYPDKSTMLSTIHNMNDHLDFVFFNDIDVS